MSTETPLDTPHPDAVCLRPTEEDDLDFVLVAEGDEENRPFISQWTREQHRSALANLDIVHRLVVQGSCPVGYAILLGLAGPDRCILLKRIVIQQKGRGYGRQALQLIQQFAFEQLGAHRLWLDVKTHNHRARHLYAAVGFVEEGILRECLKAEASYESLVVMSMLESEYRSPAQPLPGDRATTALTATSSAAPSLL